MKTKHAISIAMIFVICGAAIQITDYNFVKMKIGTAEELRSNNVTSAGPVPMEPLDLNVATNPSFEEANAEGRPSDYTAYGSGYQFSNTTYQDDVSSGTYSCLVESQGTEMAIANAYIRNFPTFSPEPYLIDGAQLIFRWNTLANPDMSSGSRVYLSVQTTNSTGVVQYIYYYLSHTTSGFTNSSTSGHFYLNDTLNQWNDFDRNITEDYQDIAELGNFDSSRYIVNTWLYAYSLVGATGKIQVVFDDFVLTNGTYSGWYSNGDFETGTGSGWSSYFNSPGFVTRSLDSTHGSYSAELNIPTMSMASTAYCGLYDILTGTPQGYYATSSGSTTIEFDWYYDDAPGQEFQYSYLRLDILEGSTTHRVYSYIGHGADSPSATNTSTNKYVNVTNFGVRGMWQHEVIDLYDYVMMFGSTDMAFFRIEFYAYAIDTGCSVTTKIDNLQILTDPTGDPGFEVDYFSSASTPFAGWYAWSGETGVISRTSDVHSGLIACNLTVDENDYAGVRRPINVQIDSDLLTDFWWRLDELTEIGSGWAYLELSFNNSRFVNYHLGHSSLYSLPANNSNTVHVLADDFNQTGQWNNFVRNITHDVTAAFGESNYILTRLIVNTYAGAGGRTSLICDDMNFKDGSPPVITDVSFFILPSITPEPVLFQAVVDDIRPGVSNVTFSYSIGNGWTDLQGVYDEGGWYTANVPPQNYGSLVMVRVTAIDGSGQISIDDNDGNYYTYTIDDFTFPSVSITSPFNGSNIEGNTTITVSASDAESGIAYVEIWIDATLSANLTSSPYEYSWNTGLVTAGSHEIEAIAFNNAGLSSLDNVTVTVLDSSTTTTTSGNGTTGEIPPLVITIAAAGIIVVVMILLVAIRKKK